MQVRTKTRTWVRLVVLAVAVIAVAAAGQGLAAGIGDSPAGALLAGVFAAVAGIAAYRWGVRRLERREPAELTWRPAGAGRGTVLGIALFAVVIGVIAAAGDYRASRGSVGGLLITLGLMLGAAVTEELLFRGVLFRIVDERFGLKWALGGSAVLFGGAHLLNPDATLWGAVAIAVEAGLMLGAAYARSRTLWLPIGLHLGWNLAEGGIFGATVSGSGARPDSLLIGHLHGPALLTGGTFGPEASLVSVAVGLVVTWLFLRRR